MIYVFDIEVFKFKRKEVKRLLEFNRIYNMDCLEGMKLLDDNSIDNIVTDPPYELGFMGKKWDNTGIAYNIELWKECLRILKPGGHLLAFGGTRTYHRMACAIEDAGFEIRDCIQWLYGSGFPKSHNISKAIDKKAGAKRDIIGVGKGAGKNPKGFKFDDKSQSGGHLKSEYNLTAHSTPEAQQWDGWGTALKPANEPIVLARKPLSEKTVAENVLKWGTGGINIDGCRIGTEEIKTYGKRKGQGVSLEWSKYTSPEGYEGETHQGRFPTNVILDEEAGKLLDEQSGKSLSKKSMRGVGYTDSNIYGSGDKDFDTERGYNDSGGASRFFYCAKATKKERGEGNNHPTVKPVSLIKYLVTLVTPPDGVCLDPFMGSGTTAIACINTNRFFIGFELDKDYCDIANKRIEEHAKQMSISDIAK
jgi:DNA modification methylase